ncbi:SDR family NAD(P)-dependent oxidoreductase [Paenibacillus oryzisoli]|uniref:2-deoxy-D-gluconate 3-dehydrogenase n=1 Tax=Paenibacillus oryzisoli TaxID=1850517 RepID=A0A197ZZN4_9BACL|nr:glucose 1-dehydrogenase [Paenibacillus oryzisoli]OAS14395.1 2-deoxy-D-gluconate 3-dehydrogenase [Paenibacillus oryzisoli]
MFDLTGKKAIVTGASRGLGRGMAAGLHHAGAEVVILDISDDAEATAKELGASGPAVYAVMGNLEDRKDRERAFSNSLELLGGKLDILINNAGVHDRRSCLDLPLEAWERVMEVNINAIYHLCKMAGELMLEQKSGKIINMGSMLSFIGGFNATAYAASKGAVAQLTKSLSNEWAGHGIQVNAIAPGYMDTSMNKDLHADAVRYPQVTSRIPAGRWGTPEDLQGIAVFLASPASSYITGTVIPVDGGYLVR